MADYTTMVYFTRTLVINNKLYDWLESKSDKKLLLIHGDFDSLIRNSRYLRKRRLNEYISTGKVIILDNWIQDTSSDQIVEFIKS